MIIYIGEEDTSLMLLSEACHTNFVVFATKSSASFCRARFSQEKNVAVFDDRLPPNLMLYHNP